MSEEIAINKKQYIELLKCREKLIMLEAAGVDNWEWYGDALYPSGEESFADICDGIDKQYSTPTGI